MHEQDEIRRPLTGHKTLVIYPMWSKWSVGIILGVVIVISVLIAVELRRTFISKSESDNVNSQGYKDGLDHTFDRINNLVVCGSIYIAFFGHGERCTNQSNPKEEGPKATDLALITIGALQFWVYLRQARILSRQAKISADTLDFISTQDRPYILVTDITIGVHKRDGSDNRYDPEVVAQFINAGRTPAIIHSIQFDGPDNWRHKTPPGFTNVYTVHCTMTPGDRPVKYGFPIYDTSSNPMGPTFLYVRVHYADVFGRFWATASSYRLDWRDRCSRTGGRAFNYDRREKEKPDYWPGEEPLSMPFSARIRQEMRIRWLWLITRNWWPW